MFAPEGVRAISGDIDFNEPSGPVGRGWIEEFHVAGHGGQRKAFPQEFCRIVLREFDLRTRGRERNGSERWPRGGMPCDLRYAVHKHTTRRCRKASYFAPPSPLSASTSNEPRNRGTRVEFTLLHKVTIGPRTKLESQREGARCSACSHLHYSPRAQSAWE